MVSGIWYQAFTTLACAFGYVAMGSLNVWPSYTQYIYTANDTNVLTQPMTNYEVALLGSLPSLGGMVGAGMIGVIIETLGRKFGGIAISIPYVLSWTLIYVSSSSLLILSARFLGGIAGGAFLVYAPIFISEVAEDSIRGLLASVPPTFYGVGVLLSYILGWFLSYTMIIWINIMIGVMCCILIMSVRESPVYLLRRNRDEDARNAIAHYKGLSPTSAIVSKELSKLKLQLTSPELVPVNEDTLVKLEKAVTEKLNSECDIPEPRQNMSSWRLLFTSATSRRAFIILISTIGFQVFMGLISVQVFAKKVFVEADPARADLFSVIFALVFVSGSILSGVVADKAGRRFLVITSSLLVAAWTITLGLQTQYNLGPPWVTVVLILCYCFSFMCGAGTVPYMLMSEIFMPEVQNLASILAVECVWFFSFSMIGIFPYITLYLGIHGAFYIFACFAALNAVTSYYIVPETKGLSNLEIQDLLSKRRRK